MQHMKKYVGFLVRGSEKTKYHGHGSVTIGSRPDLGRPKPPIGGKRFWGPHLR